MEDDPGRARGRRERERDSPDDVKPSRRPGDEIPLSEQPREKVLKQRSHESSPEDGAAGSSKTSPHGSDQGDNGREIQEQKPRIKEEQESRGRGGNGDGTRGGGDRGGGDRGGRGRPRLEIVESRPENIESKCGTSGQQVSLQANYFTINKKPSWRIFKYRVDFTPEIELIRVRKGVLSEHKRLLGGFLFDGTMLFTSNKLDDEITELTTKSRMGETYLIKIKYVGTVSMKETQSLQVLNLIVRKAMEGLQLQLVGRNFFDPKAKIDLSSFKIQLWPGYTTSIRQHERDILLCAEIAHKVMRTDTIYTILQRCTRESDNFQEAFKREVIGMTVLTDYNNKTYRVDDVDFNSSPLKTFNTKDGDISFVDYYQKKYHIRIRDPEQPVLISVSKERQKRAGQNEIVILIPELCRATGLNDAMRTNFTMMRAMSEHTRLGPDRRIERLKAFNRRLAQTDASMKILQEWNLALDSNLVEFPGRVLKPEMIVFGLNKKVPAGENADWTRCFRDTSMYTTVDLKRWSLICPTRSQREARQFCEVLIDAARGMRMNIAPPTPITIYDDRNHSYINAIEQCANSDPQLIMCVVPNNNAERYSSIKKKTCVDRAIPTQVMCYKTITPKGGGNPRSLMSVATKVAIQMNCKLGAAAWMIDLPLTGLMTIGYDLCRSTRDKSKAFGALIATMDLKKETKYFSAVSPHRAGDNLSNELTVSVTKALQEYRALHGTLPSKILLYRDGVGDGQIHQVLEHEVTTLTNRLKKIYASCKIESGPRLAFVIVSKNINTRYFVRGRNPLPGTIADDVVTLPERYDFFLVSQSVRQGTVSPTSYSIVYDNIGLDPDRMQILTYKMTHLYYNWSGTTRVPAVCQYAKKLATLVAQSIHQPPSNMLEKQLYFL